MILRVCLLKFVVREDVKSPHRGVAKREAVVGEGGSLIEQESLGVLAGRKNRSTEALQLNSSQSDDNGGDGGESEV